MKSVVSLLFVATVAASMSGRIIQTMETETVVGYPIRLEKITGVQP